MIEKMLTLLICLIGLSGCDFEQGAMSKHEYSILQVSRYKYKEVAHDKDYVVLNNAWGSEKSVILLPEKSQPTGYIVVLAQAEAPPLVKTIPENSDFTLSKDTLLRIKSEIFISKEVEQFLMSHLQ